MSTSALRRENLGVVQPDPFPEVPRSAVHRDCSSAPGLIFEDIHAGLDATDNPHLQGRFWDTRQLRSRREWARMSLVGGFLVILVGLAVVAINVRQAESRPEPNLSSTSPAEPSVPPTLERSGDSTRIGAIHYLSDDHSTRVTVDLNRLAYFKAHRLTGPERVYFDFPGTRMPKGLRNRTIEVSVADPLVKKIRVAEWKPGITRVVLEITQRCDYSALIASAPYRLVVTLHASE